MSNTCGAAWSWRRRRWRKAKCLWVQSSWTGAASSAACRVRQSADLTGLTLYSTVEPCVLCGYVARTVGIGQVVYGIPAGRLGAYSSAYALLTDASVSGWAPPPAVVSGILQADCAVLMDHYPRRRSVR